MTTSLGAKQFHLEATDEQRLLFPGLGGEEAKPHLAQIFPFTLTKMCWATSLKVAAA